MRDYFSLEIVISIVIKRQINTKNKSIDDCLIEHSQKQKEILLSCDIQAVMLIFITMYTYTCTCTQTALAVEQTFTNTVF